MVWLRKASQLALIGNIAFLACVLLKYVRYVQDQDMTSLVIILGWIVGVWVNLAVNTWVLILWIRRRRDWPGWRGIGLPPWLGRTNATVALIQIFYLFII